MRTIPICPAPTVTGMTLVQLPRRTPALVDAVLDLSPNDGLAQRLREVHLAGLVARRVGVGDVAGDHALPLGAQQQRLRLEVDGLAEAGEHGGSGGDAVRPILGSASAR